ncbi:hypothetical protein N657DRAFT_631085 [Parathielavia appendiculata]|uniref:Uncharacterized protein n=1 Tax=Parathielavia appendiculata TaxID=2587402 RepID=A0AAN6U681_9PEZI|nr:hypothetical protein N657DRAFT_631085 [Parathielavia appendiculata]
MPTSLQVYVSLAACSQVADVQQRLGGLQEGLLCSPCQERGLPSAMLNRYVIEISRPRNVQGATCKTRRPETSWAGPAKGCKTPVQVAFHRRDKGTQADCGGLRKTKRKLAKQWSAGWMLGVVDLAGARLAVLALGPLLRLKKQGLLSGINGTMGTSLYPRLPGSKASP